MRNLLKVFPCLLVALAAVFSVSALAGEPNVARIRVESLDRLTSQIEDLGLEGVTRTVDGWVDTLSFGLAADAVDRSRPLVVVLPQAGLMAGQNGVVTAIPLLDTKAWLEALEVAHPEQSVQDEIHSFELNGRPIHVWPLGRYVAMGALRPLVSGFDLDESLDAGGLPRGVVAGEIDLESVAPLIRMGLTQARQAVSQKLASGDEAADSVTTMVELYFDLVDDVLNNVSRLQFAGRLAGEDLIVHQRVLPVEGSTLDGLLEAQQGGLPRLARFVDPAESTWIVAGQMTLTTLFRDALASYAERYGAALEQLGDAFDDVPGVSGLGDWFAALASPAVEMLSCYRGDLVSVFRLNEAGMRAVNLMSLHETDACREAQEEMLAALSEVGHREMLGMTLEVERNAFEHRGVRAMRQTVGFGDDGGAPVSHGLQALYGEADLQTITGFHGETMFVVSGGAAAEQEFRDLVDRVETGRKSAGISPDLFAPLQSGPGYFARLDVGALIDTLAASADEESVTRKPSGAVVLGARLDRDALHVELALPTTLWREAGGEPGGGG